MLRGVLLAWMGVIVGLGVGIVLQVVDAQSIQITDGSLTATDTGTIFPQNYSSTVVTVAGGHDPMGDVRILQMDSDGYVIAHCIP